MSSIKIRKIDAIPEEDIIKLQKKFDRYDKDHSGYLDREEISRFMGAMVSDESIPGLAIKIFDSNDDGIISFQEFVEFYQALKLVKKDNFILYKMLFDAIDKDKKGYLNKEEMKNYFPYVVQPGQSIDDIILTLDKCGYLEDNGTKLTKRSLEEFFAS